MTRYMTTCPDCGADLTAPNSVIISLRHGLDDEETFINEAGEADSLEELVDIRDVSFLFCDNCGMELAEVESGG